MATGSRYLVALVALLVLTGLSWGLSYLPLSAASPWLALSIASIKAGIVALVFMHLADAAFSYRFVALVTVLFIVILCFGLVSDVSLR